MNFDSESTSSRGSRHYGPSDWDATRIAFAGSIMVDTSLTSLAQNLDLPDWPIEGPQETPGKYISLTYSELGDMPEISGQTERIDQLIRILKGTAAFDDPFGEMVSDPDPEKDNPILKNLAKLGIPEDFPMPLVALTAETREYCTSENLSTLKEFALFAQSLAQSVVVGGDFKALLNALSHIDESTLALYLPYRPGQRGLYLIEGLALTVRAYPFEVQATLAKEFGARLSFADSSRAAGARTQDVATAKAVLTQHTAAYVEYFELDLAQLQGQINQGVALGRLATVLNDAIVETIITNLVKPYLQLPLPKAPSRATTPPMEANSNRKTGFLASVARMFRK